MIQDSPAINARRGCAPIGFLILHRASSTIRYVVHRKVFDVPRYQRGAEADREGSNESTIRGQSYTQPRVIAKNSATTTPQVPTSSGPASHSRIWDEIGSISLG